MLKMSQTTYQRPLSHLHAAFTMQKWQKFQSIALSHYDAKKEKFMSFIVIHNSASLAAFLHKNNTVSLLSAYNMIYSQGRPGDQPPCRPHTEQLLPLAVYSGRQGGTSPWPRHPAHRTRHLLLEEWTVWHSWYVVSSLFITAQKTWGQFCGNKNARKCDFKLKWAANLLSFFFFFKWKSLIQIKSLICQPPHVSLSLAVCLSLWEDAPIVCHTARLPSWTRCLKRSAAFRSVLPDRIPYACNMKWYRV